MDTTAAVAARRSVVAEACREMADEVRRATGHVVEVECGGAGLLLCGASETALAEAVAALLPGLRSIDPSARAAHSHGPDEDEPAATAYQVLVAIDWDRVAARAA